MSAAWEGLPGPETQQVELAKFVLLNDSKGMRVQMRVNNVLAAVDMPLLAKTLVESLRVQADHLERLYL